MRAPNVIHAECQGHVSLAFGACYCTKTAGLYINPSLVQSGKFSINPVDVMDWQAAQVIVARFFKTWKRVRLNVIVVTGNNDYMPGMKMDGLDADDPGSFQVKGVK